MIDILIALALIGIPLAYALGCWVTSGDWINYIKDRYENKQK